jgi:hypothetical protein
MIDGIVEGVIDNTYGVMDGIVEGVVDNTYGVMDGIVEGVVDNTYGVIDGIVEGDDVLTEGVPEGDDGVIKVVVIEYKTLDQPPPQFSPVAEHGIVHVHNLVPPVHNGPHTLY